MVLLVSWLAEIIGITSLIGAFSIGLIVPRGGTLVTEMASKVEDLITVVFLPIFFTVSGLRTQIGLVNTGELWGLTLLIIGLSIVGKVSGCVLSARWVAKLTWLDSIIFGILMNTKGLVALISLNLGLSAKIITPKLFTMCVIMVIFNTVITGPLVNLVYRAFKRSDMQADIAASEDPEAKGGSKSVVVCVSSDVTAPVVVSAAAMLFNTASGVQSTLLRVSDKSDRPSEYMNKFNFLAYRRDATIRVALKSASTAELIFSKIRLASIERTLPVDIAEYAKRSGATALLVGARKLSALARRRHGVLPRLLSRTPCDCFIAIGKKQQVSAAQLRSSRRVVLPIANREQVSVHDNLAIEIASSLAENPDTHVVMIVRGNADNASDSIFSRVYSRQTPRLQVLFAESDSKIFEMIQSEVDSDNHFLSLCGYESTFASQLARVSRHPVLVCFSRKSSPATDDDSALLLPEGYEELQEVSDSDEAEAEARMPGADEEVEPPARNVEVSSGTSS